MNKFPYGIETNDGSSMRPALRFLTNLSTGVYLDNKQKLCLSQNGVKALSIDNYNFEILRSVKLTKGASAGAHLVSDASGNASWQTTNVCGSFPWNSIYKKLNVGLSNNEAPIVFAQSLASVPVTTLSLESNVAIYDFNLFIKNKTNNGLTIFADSFMTKPIVTSTIDHFAICTLINDNIGTVFYNIDADRIEFVANSPTSLTGDAPAVIVDDTSAVGPCDIAVVNEMPAIIYIADNGNVDEWRYVSAKDIYGKSWNTPVTLLSSTADINFTQTSIHLLVNNEYVLVFLNDQTGCAKILISADNGVTWGSALNISNLNNHQILDVKIVNGIPAVIARSNVTSVLYYVRANKDDGSSWPIGATQLYRDNGTSMFAKSSSATLDYVNSTLTIIATENTTNKLYIASATDSNGAIWGTFVILDENISTTNPSPCLFNNGGTTYVVYNVYLGIPSEKKLITFNKNGIPSAPRSFICTLESASEHRVLQCSDSSSYNIMAITSAEALTMLKFYGDDLVVNWSCNAATQ